MHVALESSNLYVLRARVIPIFLVVVVGGTVRIGHLDLKGKKTQAPKICLFFKREVS